MGIIKINKRSLKYGSNSLILIVAVIAIAIVVNLLVGMGDFKLDLTQDKLYTIGDDSKTILKDIKKDVTIYGLFDDTKDTGFKTIIDFLDQYKKYGIKVTYIDPVKEPGTITSLVGKENTSNISKGDLVVKSGNKTKKLSSADLFEQSDYGVINRAESQVTGAIKFVTADVTPIAYFVEGHDESTVTADLTMIKSSLENNNMEVKSLNLSTKDKVPDDCKLLVFPSPKKDLTEAEKVKVNAYLKTNGRAVFLFDPVESGTEYQNFEEVLDTFNVGINYDKVKELDDSLHISGDEYALGGTLESNEINSSVGISNNVPLFLPDSRSIKVLNNAKEWLTTTSLIKTSDKSQALNIINKGTTESGPFDLAIASEIKGGSKVLVFGNGSFINDTKISSQNSTQSSASYFLGLVVNWMQDKSDQTTITPKILTEKTITASESQAKIISVLLIGVLPLIIMACGLVVWSRRRHL